MNWEAFGSIAELLGAIAVVASLFYVGAQVRESSRATRGQTLNQLSSDMNANLREVLGNDELRDIGHRVMDGDHLEPREEGFYAAWVLSLLRTMESAHYQVQLGLLDDRQFFSLIDTTTLHLGNPIGKKLWDSRASVHDPEFRKAVESQMDSRSTVVKEGFGL